MKTKIIAITISVIVTVAAVVLAFPFLKAGYKHLFAPTYPKEEIPSAIQKICVEEHGITEKIDVKISGKTLGVRILLDDLLDINLKMQEKAIDKLQNLLRVIRRICLSTDAELNYYVIIGYEKKMGIEVVFYSYIDDMKRAMAGWMSPDDYFQRLIKTMRMDTLRWGTNRIEKLVKDLESGNMIKVIVSNFADGIKLSNLDPEFIKTMTDLGKKSYIRFFVSKKISVPVGSQERLFFLEAKEYYTPVLDDTTKLQYPSGTTHKFYILTGMEDLNSVIKNIFTEASLPEQYKNLGAPDKWNENDFFVEDFVFHEFLSTQIVQRMQSEISEPEEKKKGKEKDKESHFTLKGDFVIGSKLGTQVKLTDPSNNIFKIIISAKKNKSAEVPEKIKDIALKTVKEVCDKYKFYDLGEVQIVDNKGNSIATVDKHTLFRKNW